MRLRNIVVLAGVLTLGAVGTVGCGARPISELEQTVAASVDLVSQDAPVGEPAASVIDGIVPDASIAAGVPADVRARKLSLSSSVGYPPMEMFADDGTTIIGLDPAMGLAIARVLGMGLEVTNEDFNAQIPGLLTGRYDMVMSSMSDTAERQQKVTFIDYVQAGAGMLVAAGNPKNIGGAEQLCGLTVSVVDNGSSLALAEQYAADCAAKGKPKLELLRFPGDQDALLALKSGRADANITDYVVAAFKASDASQKIEAIDLPGTESPWGIAMNPEQKELIAAVHAALEKLVSDGTYGKILAAYNLEKIAVTEVTINGGGS